jgi:hypothetical protein
MKCTLILALVGHKNISNQLENKINVTILNLGALRIKDWQAQALFAQSTFINNLATRVLYFHNYMYQLNTPLFNLMWQ